MSATPNTHQKALAVNLDDKIYGTIAEIGAAQEVAGWLFRVGAAAGSIAKSLSAYDKQVSDEIYGESGRYVSRERLESMLDREYKLLVKRLSPSRGQDTRFFAFCNTVSARNFAGTNECQGWVGLRFQSQVAGEPNTIILHINMLDDSATAQQEVVGVLGVNLIYAAFFHPDDTDTALASLADNIGNNRLEADLVDASGPAFEGQDSIATAMAIVQGGLAKAVLLDHEGRQQPPTEVLHKCPAVIERTSLRYSSAAGATSLERGAGKLLTELASREKEPLKITELSIKNVHMKEHADPELLLGQVRNLVACNDWVMVTCLDQSFRLNSYIRRYSQQPVRYVVGISKLVMLFSEKFYKDAETSLLEATGKLYSEDARVYVKPMSRADFQSHLEAVELDSSWFEFSGSNTTVSLDNLRFHGPLQRLYEYLRESDWITPLPEE